MATGPEGAATPLPEADEYYELKAPSTRWLLDETPEALTLHEAALRSRDAVELLINHLLPDFIADAYQIEVVLPPVISIAAGESVELALAAVGRDSVGAEDAADDDPLRFPIAEAATGYTVWLQLAIREACARAKPRRRHHGLTRRSSASSLTAPLGRIREPRLRIGSDCCGS